jgi:hypothetical protein
MNNNIKQQKGEMTIQCLHQQQQQTTTTTNRTEQRHLQVKEVMGELRFLCFAVSM